jgi:hypothetical protein
LLNFIAKIESGQKSPILRVRISQSQSYFIGVDGKLMAVDVKSGPGGSFQAGAPKALFDFHIGGGATDRFDVAKRRPLSDSCGGRAIRHTHHGRRQLDSRIEQMTLAAGTRLASYEIVVSDYRGHQARRQSIRWPDRI